MIKFAFAVFTALTVACVLAQSDDDPFSPDEALNTATCTSNVRQGNACCKATCAVCGGPNCGIDNMGSSCCVSQIRASGRDCRFNPPPCVIPQLPSPTPVILDPTCSSGIIALNRAGTTAVCCPATCGACGGANCANRPGGAISCCVGRIIRRNVRCNTNSPPCVLSVVPPPPPPTTPPPVTPNPGPIDPLCETGILGTNSRGTACCARSCRTCGGGLCGERRGGASSCCINNILRNAPSCNLSNPPCVPAATPAVTPTSTRTPSASPRSADPNCVSGIQNSRRGRTVCCPRLCGMCGGPMCADLPGGLTNCCINNILNSRRRCDSTLPPCIVVSPSPTPTRTPPRTPSSSPSPLTADPGCSLGITAERNFGTVCCLASCLVCGGADCGDRVGGVDGCCIPRIRRNAGSCQNNLPPCIITSPTPSPSSTPAPNDPNCVRGIVGENENGRACCASSCGTCGGDMCGQLPGGVNNCCINRIVNSEQFCSEKLPPCTLARF